MRKNLSKVYNYFHVGRKCLETWSIWTDGDTIYSYGTAIATYGDYVDEVVVNVTKYSSTTSTHQNAILAQLRKEGYSAVEVDNLPEGVSSEELFSHASFWGTSGKEGWEEERIALRARF
jgi:hypothetical protein